MAEQDILMQQRQQDGSYNQLHPITKASNVNYTNSALSGVSNTQQGLDSIVNTLGNINLNNYFTKTQTLTSSTAALFGLGTDAVPDDVLAYVGKYAQYWWRRRTFEATKIDFGPVEQIKVLWRASSSRTWDVPYSEEISIVGSVAELKDQKTLSVSYSTYTEANKLKGKYFYEYDTENVCYVEPSAPDATRSGSYDVYISAKKVQKVTPGHPTGEWEYIQSSDRSAYPDSGEQDGYEYQYLGVPFDIAATAPAVFPKIATGSYVGTGTYGANSPNSLTFEFEPKLVFISAKDTTSPAFGILYSGSLLGVRFDLETSNTLLGRVSVSQSDETFKWSNASSAYGQLNESGTEYQYTALG